MIGKGSGFFCFFRRVYELLQLSMTFGNEIASFCVGTSVLVAKARWLTSKQNFVCFMSQSNFEAPVEPRNDTVPIGTPVPQNLYGTER